jgi:hypothetical protein
MQRFYFEKLNDAKVMEQCQVKISNRLAALENLNDNVDISCENNIENIKISAKACPGHCDLKQHKPWFNEEC